jgi:WD40 repeat protein
MTLNTGKSFLYALASSPDGKALACSNQGGPINTYDFATGKRQATLKQGASYALAYSPNGKQLASEEKGELVRVWDLATQKTLFTLPDADDSVHRLAFQEHTIATEDYRRKSIKLWDLATRKPRLVLKHAFFCVNALVFSPNGKMLLAVGNRGPITLWDARTGNEVWSFTSHRNPSSDVVAVEAAAFAPDGKAFATGGIDRTVRVWDIATRKERLALRRNRDWIISVAYSPDGTVLAAASGRVHDEPGDVHFWNAASGAYLGGRDARKMGVHSIHFSHDGKRLAVGAAGGPNGFIDIWDVSSLFKRLAK